MSKYSQADKPRMVFGINLGEAYDRIFGKKEDSDGADIRSTQDDTD